MFKEILIYSLDSYLKTLLGEEIALYGAGAFGCELYSVLSNFGIKPIAFLDRNKTGKLFNTDIIHPENYNNKNSTVIISIVLNKSDRIQIEQYLKALGFNKIIDGQSIRARYVNFTQDFKYNLSDIKKPLEFFEDNESKNTYIKNINAHFTRNYDDCAQCDEKFQYFINLNKDEDFSNFVDCGAYIGDTYLEAQKANIKIKKYYAFEPIRENYEKLTKNVNSNVLIPYNYAVSNEQSTVKFKNMAGSSAICDNGEQEVKTIDLDSILKNKKIDFIKIDIEGEEIKALMGAYNVISKNRPNMAICVYHYINHFWEIPNLIFNWNLDYKLYLRTHSSACMETVLYVLRR